MSEIYSHPQALVESEEIGPGTRIWAFAHVMKGAVLGSECNIGDHSFIESGVRIGDRVTIKNGVSVWDGVEIGDDVFVGPNAVFTNDLFPRSRVYHDSPVKTTVQRGASIGANATIIAGVRLGEYCMIGAGAVVTKDVADYQLVLGNPAKPAGWIAPSGERLVFVNGRCEVAGESYVEINGKIKREVKA